MSYLDHLREYEREHPEEYKALVKRFGIDRTLEKPDKLKPYRGQRLNRPHGPGSYEPEHT